MLIVVANVSIGMITDVGAQVSTRFFIVLAVEEVGAWDLKAVTAEMVAQAVLQEQYGLSLII